MRFKQKGHINNGGARAAKINGFGAGSGLDQPQQGFGGGDIGEVALAIGGILGTPMKL